MNAFVQPGGAPTDGLAMLRAAGFLYSLKEKANDDCLEEQRVSPPPSLVGPDEAALAETPKSGCVRKLQAPRVQKNAWRKVDFKSKNPFDVLNEESADSVTDDDETDNDSDSSLPVYTNYFGTNTTDITTTGKTTTTDICKNGIYKANMHITTARRFVKRGAVETTTQPATRALVPSSASKTAIDNSSSIKDPKTSKPIDPPPQPTIARIRNRGKPMTGGYTSACQVHCCGGCASEVEAMGSPSGTCFQRDRSGKPLRDVAEHPLRDPPSLTRRPTFHEEDNRCTSLYHGEDLSSNLESRAGWFLPADEGSHAETPVGVIGGGKEGKLD